MIRKILVPTDFSACSRAALREASRIALAAGAELVVLYVDEFPSEPAGELPYRPAYVLTQHAETVQRHLSALDEDVAALGCRARTQVVSGTVHHAILDAASDEKSDLIVMGTHGRSGMKRLLLGSVAERVIRTSPIPVLAVREEALAGECASAP